MLRCLIVSVCLVAAAGCEQATRGGLVASPANPSYAVGVPDPSFRLAPSERASVRPGFDVDALERLLSMLPPEVRPRTLESFQYAKEPNVGRALVRIEHPKLQAVLEEVWAPMWDGMTDEEMERMGDQFPGRELARKRRLVQRKQNR